jgi:hypothetical protein
MVEMSPPMCQAGLARMLNSRGDKMHLPQAFDLARADMYNSRLHFFGALSGDSDGEGNNRSKACMQS